MCRSEVGLSDLGQLLWIEPWSEALIGHMGGGWAGHTREQRERGDPEGVAGETWSAFQTAQAQWEEMGEAEIGLNTMPNEAEIWIEICFPPTCGCVYKQGCVYKLLYSVIKGICVQLRECLFM